jgi:glycosyltransferase involved in cell wall biosynthesis
MYYETVIRYAANRAYCIFTDSLFSKKEILEWSRLPDDKVVITGAGVGDEYTPSGWRYDPGFPYLLYVGGRKPHKNLPRLIQAFAVSKLANEHYLLLSGNPDANLSSIAAYYGIEARIRFSGIIPGDKLPGYYRGATALIMPSLYEGFGLPPLEALACGIPVVVSNRASLPEVVGDAGIYVDPLNIMSIADGIDRVISDSQLRCEIVSLGRERVSFYGWDKCALSIKKILDQAASIN